MHFLMLFQTHSAPPEVGCEMGCFDVIYQKKEKKRNDSCVLACIHALCFSLGNVSVVLLCVQYAIEAIEMLELAYKCWFLLHLGERLKDDMICYFP